MCGSWAADQSPDLSLSNYGREHLHQLRGRLSIQYQLQPTGPGVVGLRRQPVFEIGERFTGRGGGEGGSHTRYGVVGGSRGGRAAWRLLDIQCGDNNEGGGWLPSTDVDDDLGVSQH